MKHLTRYCSVLLCCLLLFSVFCTSVSAEDVDYKQYEITQGTSYCFSPNNSDVIYSTFTPNNNTVESFSYDRSTSEYELLLNNAYYSNEYYIKYSDSSIMLKKGKDYTVRINNFYHSMLLSYIQKYPNKKLYIREPNYFSVWVVYEDNSIAYIPSGNVEMTTSANSPVFDMSFKFTPTKDVSQVVVSVQTLITNKITDNGNDYITATIYHGEFNGDDKFQYSVEFTSEEAGLLKSVIEWLKGIKNGITDLFDSIKELPSKIWGFIENGLKALFVPDDNYMQNYSDDWDLLLSQRFGALYEVGELLSELGESISYSETTHTVNIDNVSLESVGIPFSFGGYDIRVVPEGFEWLVEIIKTVVSVCCTLFFINGLRKRYDEIMGVKQ